MKNSIALIGFMGTGKSAVARLLAQELHKEFIELDGVVERIAGLSIPEIFNTGGETLFREYEIEAVKQAVKRKNMVMACGGGVVLNRINIDRMKAECTLVLLTASPDVILQRISGHSTRPLLKAPTREAVEEMLAFRRPFYERAYDIKVNTSPRTVEGVVKEIIRKLKLNEHSSGKIRA